MLIDIKHAYHARLSCAYACVCVWLCVWVCVYIHISILASVGKNNSDCKFAVLRVCEALKWSKSRFNFTAMGSQLALSRNTTHADAIDAQRWWPQANNSGQTWPNNPINSYKFSKRTWKAQTQGRMNCFLKHLLALLFLCDIFAKRKTQLDAVSNLK